MKIFVFKEIFNFEVIIKNLLSNQFKMSDFCDFVPDDPSCAPVDPVDPTPTDGGDGGKAETMEKEVDGDMKKHMMEAQVTFLLTALSLTVRSALQQFRYRSDTTTYYAAGDALSPNYWQYLVTLWNVFTIGFMGIATVTQLLSMLGIAAEINVMVWMYGGLVNSVVGLISGLVAMYAYDAYWTVSEDSTSAQQSNAATALAGLEQDMLYGMAHETAAGVALYMHADAWMMAQFMALPEETQKKWLAEKEGDHEESMHAYFGF